MDRHTWMYEISRATEEYVNGVNEFITCAMKDLENKYRDGKKQMILCPCRDCNNLKKLNSIETVHDHLIRRGFKQNYTKWIWHGEGLHSQSTSSWKYGSGVDPMANEVEEDEDDVDIDRVEEMIHDVEDHFIHQPDIFKNLAEDSKKLLYPGCNNQITRLSTTLKLCKIKVKNGWSDKSFTELLKLFKEILPPNNVLPISTYEAKKILCPMGMNVKKIHACPNDCVLFRNEHEDLHTCPKCGASRYKRGGSTCNEDKKMPPSKVMWYLPIEQRFKRLFANANDAKLLRWHVEGRKSDGMLRHPADSPQWRTIDGKFPEFGVEARNLRLGLCADGMNPFRTLSSQHSTWPVLLTIYNLPPWLCMKRKYIMLALLISGPKEAGNNIDVYLQPLIEDLKIMWTNGVTVYDAYTQMNFTLRAMIFCTISDFPAYGHLSGYTVKGAKACPICEEGTIDRRLRNCKKNVYMGHRTFLPPSHPYRKRKRCFDGHIETRAARLPLTGQQVFERVKDINVVLGKLYKKPLKKCIWKKRSIFWDLPYWEHLQVRHCLDFMHIEKNVCESIIGTLLNIPGKTKDGVNARLDMKEMGIRTELAPQESGKRSFLPPACYTLSRKEKISFCECLSNVKVPSGYSSNIKTFVSMKDLKLVGLKSHDCHVLMQHLLPVAIRGILPKHVRFVITKLCFFFNAICSKVIDPMTLDTLQADIIVTLCEFEMYFPASLFDIMVHLVVHLEISEKAKSSQAHNLHPHYMGKGGYEEYEDKWRANDPLTSLSESNTIDPSIVWKDLTGRSLDWVRARMKEKEGGCYYFPKEQTKKVFEKMAEWQGKVNDGSWTPHGHDDLLTRALGKEEHGGRVRGVGGGVKIKEVFGSENYKQCGVVSVDDLEAITMKVRKEFQEIMNVKLRGIYDYLKQMGLPLPNENFGFEDINSPKNDMVRSSCHSVDQPDRFPDIQIPTLCRLCVIHSNKGRVVVARGQVFPLSSQGGDLIHGKPIAPDNVKVCVDDVEVDFQLTPLPVPSDEHEMVGNAIGSFVQWPKNLVILGQDPEKENGNNMMVSRKQKKVVSKGSVTPLKKKDVFHGKDKNLSEKCRALRFIVHSLPEGSTTKVVKNMEVFKGQKDNGIPIYVTTDDVDEFLRMSWLNIPILQIFMLYIHKLCKDLNDDSFAFMCPSVLTYASKEQYHDSVCRYLSKVMKASKEKRFILAPYIQDKHWMLLLYCLDESAVYVFDSLKQKRDLHVKLRWQMAYKIYVTRGGKKNNQNNLLWYEDVKCPQQEGGTECGFYVMRYMYDIVMLSRKDPKIRWKQGLGTGSYSEQQIDEIRDLWADFYTFEYL